MINLFKKILCLILFQIVLFANQNHCYLRKNQNNFKSPIIKKNCKILRKN